MLKGYLVPCPTPTADSYEVIHWSSQFLTLNRAAWACDTQRNKKSRLFSHNCISPSEWRLLPRESVMWLSLWIHSSVVAQWKKTCVSLQKALSSNCSIVRRYQRVTIISQCWTRWISSLRIGQLPWFLPHFVYLKTIRTYKKHHESPVLPLHNETNPVKNCPWELHSTWGNEKHTTVFSFSLSLLILHTFLKPLQHNPYACQKQVQFNGSYSQISDYRIAAYGPNPIQLSCANAAWMQPEVRDAFGTAPPPLQDSVHALLAQLHQQWKVG